MEAVRSGVAYGGVVRRHLEKSCWLLLLLFMLRSATVALAQEVETLSAAIAAFAQEVAIARSSDGPQVRVLVQDHEVGRAPLSDWRFEGFVNPEAYFISGPEPTTMHGPWAETREDVHAAVQWQRKNQTRLRSIVQRKRHRFRVGRAWSPTRRLPSYFRGSALDVSSWIALLQSAGVALSGSFVNLGANDGVGDDPLHRFAQDAQRLGLGGPKLAVEADPSLCEQHRRNLPWVRLICTPITPQNAKALIWSSFPTAETRQGLDVLKLDIDSYEAFVLEESLWRAGLQPKLILVEVNAAIPPPLQYALHDSPQLRRGYPKVELASAAAGGARHPMEVNMPVAGVSISYLAKLLAPEYGLLELGSPDAVFARADVLHALGREPLDEFQAFEWGWMDVHGFSRQQVRRWHFESDEVTALGEVHDFLVKWMEQYLGMVLPFVLTY